VVQNQKFISENKELDEEKVSRYSRSIALPEIGPDGQMKIMKTRVLVVGVGGLGSAVTIYLAAFGVGRLGLVDNDRVDLSNLQRQVIHGTGDIGRKKVLSAKDTVVNLNPTVRIDTYEERLTEKNIFRLLAGYDMVVDCTDNYGIRELINQACVETGKPFVHGAVRGFTGQVMTVVPGENAPCFKCIFRRPPGGERPGSADFAASGESGVGGRINGIFGPLPGTVGTLQAAEVIKCIIGKGRLLTGRLLIFDVLDMRFQEVEVKRDPCCPVCGRTK